MLTEARLGRPMEEALAEMAERVGSKNFDFVITAVTIQRQVGGSLAGLFDMVADTVRERQQFARKIKGLTAMGRASAYVLIALPFVMAVAITLINPGYMAPLYHTSTGHKLILIGLIMMAFGSLVLRRIVSFKGCDKCCSSSCSDCASPAPSTSSARWSRCPAASGRSRCTGPPATGSSAPRSAQGSCRSASACSRRWATGWPAGC